MKQVKEPQIKANLIMPACTQLLPLMVYVVCCSSVWCIYLTQIRELQTKIGKEEFEHKKYSDLANFHEKTLHVQQTENKKAKNELIRDIKEKQQLLRMLTLSNDELVLDTEDAVSNIEKWY